MMRSFRASRVPRIGRSVPQSRPYAVKIPGECQKDIKTVAELKAWGPSSHVPDVEVCGWVRSVRKSSGVRFIDITDGSSMRPVQVVVDKNLATEYEGLGPTHLDITTNMPTVCVQVQLSA
jgi:asparaginyl-tRNA synthetase